MDSSCKKGDVRYMPNTYEDFLTSVSDTDIAFVKEMHEKFLAKDCGIDVKQAKRGFVVTYFYFLNKKKISLMNYVFRSQGMLARIYARHISLYEKTLETITDEMKNAVKKGGDCKRLIGTSNCSPTCTAGYDFIMENVNYKKCKNSAFFWKVCKENNPFIKEIIENELKYIDIQ